MKKLSLLALGLALMISLAGCFHNSGTETAAPADAGTTTTTPAQ